MKDLTHIERSPLPWRPERATECGLDATKHPTWSRDEAQAKQQEMGKQRFSLFVCMTCMGTASRHYTWEDDPASCLVRHAQPMALGVYRRDHTEEKRRFADELRAIAALIEAHRDEFDALVHDLGDVVDLRRRQRGRS